MGGGCAGPGRAERSLLGRAAPALGRGWRGGGGGGLAAPALQSASRAAATAPRPAPAARRKRKRRPPGGEARLVRGSGGGG